MPKSKPRRKRRTYPKKEPGKRQLGRLKSIMRFDEDFFDKPTVIVYPNFEKRTNAEIKNIIIEFETLAKNYKGYALGISMTEKEENAYYESVRKWLVKLMS